MTTGILDLDIFAYRSASAGEKRTIHAYHPITGDEWKCNTRTQLYGHWIKKNRGLLAEFNAKNGTKYLADELVITDLQHPEPLPNVLHTAKVMVESALYKLGTNKQKGFLGKGDSFRVERSTLLKYKGDRADVLKPLALQEVRDYYVRKLGATLVEGLESDDWCVIEAHNNPDKVIVTADKDAKGTHCLVLNPFDEQGVVDCRGFGKLWLNNKGEVKGTGRIFMLFQTFGDSADNYKANCFSDLDVGDKTAYNALKDCKTDKEAFQAVKEQFKLMYPEPKIVTGWRGDQFEIDWKYVFNEMFDMCRMMRSETDFLVGTDVMQKLGVDIDG